MNPTTKIGAFTLLPAADGKCPDCATAHDPQLPHNQQSMFWQYRFYGVHDRWPTWADAIAHCEDHIAEKWINALPEFGGPVVTMEEIHAARAFVESKTEDAS